MFQDIGNENLRLTIEPDQRLQPVIPRDRLLQFIETPFLAPITLISAPAGFGKTTLAAQWAEHAGRLPIWVSIQTDANSPDRFLATLIAGIHAAGLDSVDESEATPEIAIAAVAEQLSQAAAAQPLVLILDDYHIVDSLDVHRLMEVLLRLCAPHLPVLILSRERLPFAISRERVAGNLREVTANQLRFQHDEITSVVNLTLPNRLDQRQTEQLYQRTDGWIAGIQLVLKAFDSMGDRGMNATVASLSAHQWVEDYVVEEVIDQLPEQLRDFLLRTASLKFLDPDLCNVALGIQDSQRLIDELRQRNIFVQNVWGTTAPYAYHALFAEFVERISERRLSIEDQRSLHQRAAMWFKSRGHLEFALEQAINGGDTPTIVEMMSEVGWKLLNDGRHFSLYYWLDKLPDEAIYSDPVLISWRTTWRLQQGRTRDGVMTLLRARPALQASGDPSLQAATSAALGLVDYFEGEFGGALRHSLESLHRFPRENALGRLRAWGELATYEMLRGDDDLMWQAYRQAERCQRQLSGLQPRWSTFIEPERANWSALRGDLTTADRLLTHLIERLPSHLVDAGHKLRCRRAAISLEWNRLDRVREDLDLFLHGPEGFPVAYWAEEGIVLLSKFLWLTGDRDGAVTTLQQAIERLGDKGGPMLYLAPLRALQAEFWLQMGELNLARDWFRTRPRDGYQWPTFFGGGGAYSTQVQLAMAERSPALASERARQFIAQAHTLKQWSATIPLLLWDFAAQLMLGNEVAAATAIRKALDIGMGGGFVQSFALPEPTIVSLYERIMPHLSSDEAAYLRKVIASRYRSEAATEAESAPDAEQASPTVVLREPLSRRERDVLRLLAEGLRNREIGERLFISERTVKKHMTSLMAKLNATSRATALKHARDVELL